MPYTHGERSHMGNLSILNLYSTEQSIMTKQFCHWKKSKKIHISQNGINQYKQKHDILLWNIAMKPHMTLQSFVTSLFSSNISMKLWFSMRKAVDVMDHCTHPNAINHAICSVTDRQRSHLSNFLFSACFLVDYQLCISSFAAEKYPTKLCRR